MTPVASRRTVGALIALMASLVPTAAMAQSADGPLRVWLALGLAGAGVQGLDAGIGGTAELTGQWREHHASLRMLGLADFAGTAEAGIQTTFIGLSVQAFANLNAEASWAGVAGRVLLGWMP